MIIIMLLTGPLGNSMESRLFEIIEMYNAMSKLSYCDPILWITPP